MITDWLKTKPSDDGNHIGMRIGYRNLPKGLDPNCYEPIYMKDMKIKHRLNSIEFRLQQLEAKFSEQPILENPKPIATTNHNSVSDALGNTPAYEIPDFVPDWKDAPEDAEYLAMEKNGMWLYWEGKPEKRGNGWNSDSNMITPSPGTCTNAERLHPDWWKQSLQERLKVEFGELIANQKPNESEQDYKNRSEVYQQILTKPTKPEYTHLLPDGYEFCSEQDAEKWVKVELGPVCKKSDLGFTVLAENYIPSKYYRPIRLKRFHVAIHEAVTSEPDPYQVDWSKAPEWADSHSYQSDGYGWWHGSYLLGDSWVDLSEQSGFTLPSGLDWKQSKRRRLV